MPVSEPNIVSTDPKDTMQAIHLEEKGKAAASPNGHYHGEAMAQDVTAAKLANEMLQVDDERAAEIRRELAKSKQAGWKPNTSEELQLNRRLNWKLDLMVIPLLAIAYMFNQLDRTNLGNAQTAGFSKDLGINSSAVNTASSIFFATYVPFQPLASALGRRVGAPRFLGATLVLWGILTICHGFVKNNAQLITLRLLMGLAECGFYPTVLAYLSELYPRFECAFRFALFYGFFSVGGAFGGLLAFGILKAHGALYSWQYLFIIEGSVPILLGFIAPFWLARDVGSAWYLNTEERAFAEKRMVMDTAANFGHTHKVTATDFKEAFLDWRVWSIMLSNTMASLSSQGFTVFFPVVVKGLGYDTGTVANLMTVPPYVAGAIGVWLFSWSSDRFHERTLHLLAGITIVIIGLILTIVIPLDNIGGRYAGLMILMFGAFIHSPIAVAWLAGNTPEPGKRTVAIGISGWANVAGIIGSELFQAKYGPGYVYPLRVTVGLMSVAWFGFGMTSIALRFVNRWRVKKLQGKTPEEIEAENRSDVRIGDKKWTFVYGL